MVAFDLWQDGAQTHYEWLADAGDEVRCTYVECDRERIELKFEEQGGAPRLTMQVCGYGRTTAFEAISPASFPDCEDGVVGVVIEWEQGDSFVSATATAPCTLHVNKTEVTVTGSFECAALVGANGAVRISTGTFSCAAQI